MKKEGCDFREALTMLGERAGVALHQKRDVQEDARRSRLFEANEAAAAYFAALLRTESGPHASGAAAARAYVASRQTADASVEMFQSATLEHRQDACLPFRGTWVCRAGAMRGWRSEDRGASTIPARWYFHHDAAAVAGFGGRLFGDALAPAIRSEVRGLAVAGVRQGGDPVQADAAKDAIRARDALRSSRYMDAIAARAGYGVVASMAPRHQAPGDAVEAPHAQPGAAPMQTLRAARRRYEACGLCG
jgi:hypothetical protein